MDFLNIHNEVDSYKFYNNSSYNTENGGLKYDEKYVDYAPDEKPFVNLTIKVSPTEKEHEFTAHLVLETYDKVASKLKSLDGNMNILFAKHYINVNCGDFNFQIDKDKIESLVDTLGDVIEDIRVERNTDYT
ncbi:hypothetical protein EDL79_04915 [Ehrlichia ruminantium]|uniref:Uncharacterized protein n=1 Tax=Ehrlichia ruminantium TaxID=779 RepID=A0AAE6Q9K7_EHRRU|nr:hypothetical protein [Ehrlichia ruminantium]QGR03864.1 hypothetical protein EDL80_04905 [Ehrlichia ruminantium]QGR04791.1 hypothetical protein EDL79_04915 [Ehrlichia ruminantium]